MFSKENFLAKVSAYVKREALWEKRDRILAAVSGGPDSLALLLVLKLLSEREGIEIGCCCVNHHLRQAADEEAQFVKRVCRDWDIPVTVKHVNVKEAVKNEGSFETAARELRYRALREVVLVGGYTKIAVAHHGDDQAETVLYHLLRGSGSGGLLGMKPINGDVIRPFLCTTKNEIKNFLSYFTYTPCHDESNDIEDVVRNRIRLSLMPELETYNPRVTDSLRRTAEILREEDSFMKEQAKVFISSAVEYNGSESIFSIGAFLGKHIALQRRIIREIARTATGRIPGFTGTERFIALIAEGRTGTMTSASGILLRIQYGRAIFSAGNTRKGYSLPLDISRMNHSGENLPADRLIKSLWEKKGNWSFEKTILFERPRKIERNQFILDADKVGNIVLRYWENGDYFSPRGVKGRKKLSRVMSDLHISSEKRKNWPVIADENHIYWIAFLRGSNDGIPDGNTQRYLLITIKKENGENEKS